MQESKSSSRTVKYIAGVCTAAALTVSSFFAHYWINIKPHQDLLNSFSSAQSADEYNGVLSSFAAHERFQEYFTGDRVQFYNNFRIAGHRRHKMTWIDDGLEDNVVGRVIHKEGMIIRITYAQPEYRAITERGLELEGVLKTKKERFSK